MVDYFEYQTSRRGRDISVVPSSVTFEKSVRLGYIMNEQSRANAHASALASLTKDQEALSIFRYADYAYEKIRKEVVRYEEIPIRRITLRFPYTFLAVGLRGLSGFTFEEHLNFSEAQKDELLTWEEMEKVQILDGLLASDLIQVFRFFAFVARFLEREIQILSDDEVELGYRSLLPVFSISDLSQIIASLLPDGNPEKVTKVIELLSSCVTKRGVFDIQYTPIIRAGDMLLLPFNILARMNWWRNLSHTQNRRAIAYADEEAASRMLNAALEGNADDLVKGFQTTLAGQHFELDVVARMDDQLFIFECKHPLVPCNVFELRTSYKHLKKGSEQLNKIVAVLSQEENEIEFYRRLGWTCGPSKKISTCIVSCNGMFAGFRSDGHPVRRIHELCNYIETGKIKIAEIGHEPQQQSTESFSIKEVDVWGDTNPQLTANLLWEYLAADNLVTPMFNAMEGYSVLHTLKTKNLIFKTYALDAVKLSRHYLPVCPKCSVC